MTSETYLVAAVGCKVNQYEAQQVREALESLGLQPVRGKQIPDLAVVNTCAVTHTASRKSRQLVRRCTHGGRTRVIVVGCGVEADAQRYEAIEGVVALVDHEDDLPARIRQLVGADAKQRPHNELSAVAQNTSSAAGSCPSVRCDDPAIAASTQQVGAAPSAHGSTRMKAPKSGQVKRILTGTVHRLAGHHRAFLKVQDGCDAGCTYCVIPRLRRHLASKPVELAVREAGDLVRAGYREIVITGIFLGAYGRTTSRRRRHADGTDPLGALVEAVASVPGLLRVRVSSLEPGDVTEELLDVMVRRPACAPHLHLPLQAGSDDVLKRMNRQYRTDAYLATVDRVWAALDRVAITTDLIVGFPGETEMDFEQTLAMIDRVGFARVHAFPFSPRAGTAADGWRDELPPRPVVRARMRRLQRHADQAARDYRRRFIGQTERVIVETPTPEGWQGRADRYFPVEFPAPAEPDLRGRVAYVAIRTADEGLVSGSLKRVE